MDIGKAFGFVFEDGRWVTKLLIAAGILLAGTVLSFLIVPGILAVALLGGYMLEIARRVMNGTSPILPEWEKWEALIVDGLKVLVILLVFFLPSIIIGLCLGVPSGFMTDSQGNWHGFGVFLNSVSGCLSFLWSIVVALLVPAAIGKFAADGQLSSAFRFGDVIALVRKNLGTYVVVAVLSWAIVVVASMVGGLLCGIGLFVTMPFAYMVIGHLYGQAYRQASGPLAAPVDVEI